MTTMEPLTENGSERNTNALVAVRVPNGATGDLETEAERRLARTDGVSDVAVDDLCGLEPGLSATTVTVAVTVETTDGAVDANLCDRLADVSCVEEVVDGHG